VGNAIPVQALPGTPVLGKFSWMAQSFVRWLQSCSVAYAAVAAAEALRARPVTAPIASVLRRIRSSP
jgi:hypothetical protein